MSAMARMVAMLAASKANNQCEVGPSDPIRRPREPSREPPKTGGVAVLGVSVDTFREACPPPGVRGRGERPVARPAQSPQAIGDGVVVACALAEDEATHGILATVFSEICSPAARRSAAIRGEPYVPPESR
jgi:hypothetical protein